MAVLGIGPAALLFWMWLATPQDATPREDGAPPPSAATPDEPAQPAPGADTDGPSTEAATTGAATADDHGDGDDDNTDTTAEARVPADDRPVRMAISPHDLAMPPGLADMVSLRVPAWSVDGSRLAFASKVGMVGGSRMWIVPVQQARPQLAEARAIEVPGGPDRKVTFLGQPVWHRDGALVFSVSRVRSRIRLFVAAPGAEVATSLVGMREAHHDLVDPAVSVDGSGLAFLAGRNGSYRVMTRPWGSAGAQEHTSTMAEHTPSLTANADSVVFGRADAVQIIDLASGVGHTLVANRAWAPVAVGSDVVFLEGSQLSGWSLAWVAGDGSTRRILKADVAHALRLGPAVSPDHRYIAVMRGEDTIVLVSIQDGRSVALACPTSCAEPALGRAGDRYLLAYVAPVEEGGASTGAANEIVVEDVTAFVP